MAKTAVKLPKWLTQNSEKPNHFTANPDLYYPMIQKELEIPDDKLDQYWIEVFFQCLKMDVQHQVRVCGVDPRQLDPPLQLEIRINSGRNSDGTSNMGATKEKWALKNYPKGRGIVKATQGREARQHFQRLRGFIAQ